MHVNETDERTQGLCGEGEPGGFGDALEAPGALASLMTSAEAA